jgi:hypothetical protein
LPAIRCTTKNESGLKKVGFFHSLCAWSKKTHTQYLNFHKNSLLLTDL